MSEQNQATEKVYTVMGRLTLQIIELQEANVILSQQVKDLSEQLQAAQLQLASGKVVKKAPEDQEVHENMPVDQAIALLREKGIPVSIDGHQVPGPKDNE